MTRHVNPTEIEPQSQEVEGALEAQRHVPKVAGKKAPFTHELLLQTYGPRPETWVEKSGKAKHTAEELVSTFHR